MEGKPLKVNVSVPNTRLFVGNIPKSKTREDIANEFDKLAGKSKTEESLWKICLLQFGLRRFWRASFKLSKVV